MQVGWFTSDGAAVNRKTLSVLQEKLTSADIDWSALDRDSL
jgi:hypothetical protein